MRHLMLATTCTIAVLATGAMAAPLTSCSGKLDQLPEGEWVLLIPPEGICVFANDAITAKVLAACSKGRLCTITGVMTDCEDSECVEVKRLRSVRPLNGVTDLRRYEFAIDHRYDDAERAKKPTSFTLACHIAYGSPPPTLVAYVERQIGSVCHQYNTLAKCEEANKKLHPYERSVVGEATWIIETDCKSDW